MADCEKLTNDLKNKIHDTFSRIYETLKNREKQIIRQIDVLLQQQQNLALDVGKISWDRFDISLESEKALCTNIMKFGEVDLSNLTLDSNLYVIEDYITPNIDHDCMYKCLDTLNIISSTEDLKVQVQFPQCKYLNLSSDSYNSQERELNLTYDDDLKETLTEYSENSPEISKERNTKNTEYLESLLDSSTEKSFTESSTPSSEDLQSEIGKHPIQVQHWLKQIITETEIEPVQNTEKQLIAST